MKVNENYCKELSKKHFDKLATNYGRSRDGRFCRSMYTGVIEKISRYSFMSLIDSGCGTGEMLSLLVKKYPDMQAFGIDFSENMISKASLLLGPNVQLLVGDVDKMPWPDNFFDLLTCNASFHHYPQPLKALSEVQRILKPNGRLIIADPWWPDTIRLLINNYLKSPLNTSGDVKIYSEQEMYQLLSESGFQSIEWELMSGTYFIATAVAS
jgi:ubiquinone/menaquinone biosynthesis C-methylase UbiE